MLKRVAVISSVCVPFWGVGEENAAPMKRASKMERDSQSSECGMENNGMGFRNPYEAISNISKSTTITKDVINK